MISQHLTDVTPSQEQWAAAVQGPSRDHIQMSITVFAPGHWLESKVVHVSCCGGSPEGSQTNVHIPKGKCAHPSVTPKAATLLKDLVEGFKITRKRLILLVNGQTHTHIRTHTKTIVTMMVVKCVLTQIIILTPNRTSTSHLRAFYPRENDTLKQYIRISHFFVLCITSRLTQI